MDCTHNVFTATVHVTRLSDTTPMQFRADPLRKVERRLLRRKIKRLHKEEGELEAR